jgi:hypothetical protein
MKGHPGLYKFTQEGYVGVVPKALYRLVQHNIFVSSVPICSVSTVMTGQVVR